MPIQKLGFHNLCTRVKGKATNNGKSTIIFYPSSVPRDSKRVQ